MTASSGDDDVARAKPEPDESTLIEIVGARRRPLRDLYHLLLRKPWPLTIALIAASFLVLNGLFGVAFALAGGVHGAAPGSLLDGFFFSVQTMSTLGYGAMYPESLAAHSLVVLEVIVGLVLTALATGLVFTKFATPRPRVFFSRRAVVTPFDGAPTLMVRIGNERGDHIVDARLRMVLTRTEKTKEGETFYRTRDLRLVRDHSASFRRGTTIMHTIDAQSPLAGDTPESLAASEAELVVSIIGIDGTTSQTVHAASTYEAAEIVFGHRLADTLSALPDGRLRLDLRRFHDTEPSAPSADFPYPRERASSETDVR